MKLSRKCMPALFGILVVSTHMSCQKRVNLSTTANPWQGGKSPIVEPGHSASRSHKRVTVDRRSVAVGDDDKVPDVLHSNRENEPPIAPKPVIPHRSEVDDDSPECRKITADGTDQIIFVEDESAVISGQGGVIMINGACSRLTVECDETQIFCDLVEEVDVKGNGNEINIGELRSGTVSGNNNTVNWEAGSEPPLLKLTGRNNAADESVILSPRIR